MPAPDDPLGGGVDRELSRPDRRIGAPRPSADDRADSRGELVEVVRLHEVVVGAGVEPRDAIRDRIARRDDEHGQLAAARAPFAKQGKAVAMRKAQVEQDEVVFGAVERGVGALRVANPVDRVAFAAQPLLRGGADHRIVFDQQ